MSYWEISSSSVGWRRPPASCPLVWSMDHLFPSEIPGGRWVQALLELVCWCFYGKDPCCPALTEKWAKSRAFPALGNLPLYHARSNTEGRIFAGGVLAWMAFLTGRSPGEGVDDWFIFLIFLFICPMIRPGEFVRSWVKENDEGVKY